MPTQTLVEKIAAIAKTIPQIEKKGDNGTYKFITAIDAFDAIRIKLFEAGILIIPTGQTITRSTPYQNVSGDMTDEVIGEFHFKITDGLEEIPCCAPGIGQDYQGKALYMASTGAKKDLIKTAFLIAGYEDDAESVQDTSRVNLDLAGKIAEMEAKCGPDSREWPIGHADVVAWGILCKKTGYQESAKKAFLKSRGVTKITDLKRKDQDLAFKWANGEEVSLGESSSSTDEESSE